MFWGGFSSKQAESADLNKHPGAIEMDKGTMYWYSCCHILKEKYGFVDATNSGNVIDENKASIPLFTYPLIEYLEQLDFRDKAIFEYGSGASTLFWMSRAKSVVSIENNLHWYKHLSQKLTSNVELKLKADDDFPWAIYDYESKFDVICVDGAGYRYDCATAAISKLNDNGMIILDNSDWHPNTAKFLREKNLIQIDMSGFKPGECHTSTTSLFLSRNFNFKPLASKQPVFSRGAKHIHSEGWDKPYAKPRS